MLLSELLKDVSYSCQNFSDCEITDIVYDSRLSKPDTLFVALVGAFTDGHDYAQGAYLKGTRCFLVQRKLPLASDAVQIVVENTRAELSTISAAFFHHPEQELDMIGVTGTKGKTTVTHLMKHCLDAIGVKSGVIGTVGAYFDGQYVPTVNTTPESYETMKLLRQMKDAGCKAVCMEVSSLGLKSHRVDGITFDIAVFTNLSPDHIGGAEHESFEEYVYWKTQLFHRCKRCVLCADDAFTSTLTAQLKVPYVLYSTETQTEHTAVFANDLKKLRDHNFFGAEFFCHTEIGNYPMKTAMPGLFSVQNALAAVAVCLEYTDNLSLIAKALAGAKVKGRNECIEVPADYDVIIDYAHNGQSFHSVLDTFGSYEHRRLITVFGSVGDRAQLRRQEMGTVSGAKADFSMITTDDPGFENPMSIAEEIASFVKKAGGECCIETDRKKAIFQALSLAKPGDIVLILGKGHETVQKVCGEKIHFSDHEAVHEYFKAQSTEE